MASVAELANIRKNMSGRKNTILLVDDESAITRIFEAELTRIGYDVLTAGNALEAQRIATESDFTIDLLITDWMMPHGKGDQLACDLLVQRPTMKVVLMSGHPEANAACQAFPKDKLVFIQKPFGVAELNGTIRQLLGLSDKQDSQVT